MPDRTSAPWWQEAAARADGMLFTSCKIKFEREDGTIGESPANGTTLFAAGDVACEVLSRSGLGRFVITNAKFCNQH